MDQPRPHPYYDDGLAAFYALMGVLQILGFGGGATLLVLSTMSSPRPTPPPVVALPWVAPGANGATAGLTVIY